MKKLSEISWNVSEEEYRNDPSLSYSILSRYSREGFNALKHLRDKQEAPSLTFGSVVDTLITSPDEFNDRFVIMDLPEISDTLKEIIIELHSIYKDTVGSISDLDDEIISNIGIKHNYYVNPKYKNQRIKNIKECSYYFDFLNRVGNKTIINDEIYAKALDCVKILKESKATQLLFKEDSPFDDTERFYQLKFKSTFNNVDYRCMVDLLIVDHTNKTIIPIDLKTSSKPEWEFYESFVKWNYSYQARLYWRIIRNNLDKDEVYKDYKLSDYIFVVISKDTLTPLLWEYPDTTKYGNLDYGNVVLTDPFTIGEELDYYLKTNPTVPKGIKLNNSNNIIDYLKTM